MSVHIELSPFLRKYVSGYSPAEGLVIESGSGKTVRQIIDELRIPMEKVNSIMVNHMPSKISYVVKDGDTVGLIMALGGG